MMREIFIPSQIGSYFIFKQQIISFDISDHSIKALLISASGSHITLEQWVEEPAHTDEERSNSLQKIKNAFGKANRIIVTLSAQQISFKNLTLPFSNLSKIRQILPFELSDALPFPLDEAVFDAIPATTSSLDAQTPWLTTALQADTMNRSLLPFLEQGLIPTRITTGPIELFATLEHLKTFEKEKNYILIASNSSSTEISLVHNQELLAVRTINIGLSEKMAGLDARTLEEEEQKQLSGLLRETTFSIEALLRAQRIPNADYTVILTENAAQMSSLAQVISEQLGKKVEIIRPLEIIKLPVVEQQNSHQIPAKFFKCITAALPGTLSQSFNLGRMFQEEQQQKLFVYQATIGIVVALLLFATPITINIFSLRRLRSEAEKSKQEITTRLKKEFNLTSRQRSLKDTLNQSEQALIKNEQLWSALTTNKYAFLRYIQKLNTTLSREKLNLDLRRLIIRRDELSGQEVISLEGAVPNFAALRDFEEGLQTTHLFVTIPRLQDLRFSMQLPVQKDALGEL